MVSEQHGPANISITIFPQYHQYAAKHRIYPSLNDILFIRKKPEAHLRLGLQLFEGTMNMTKKRKFASESMLLAARPPTSRKCIQIIRHIVYALRTTQSVSYLLYIK